MNLVGCTSFAVWNENTSDSSMIVARNFDFYFGDDFSKDKIVSFINPSKGYKFVMITWGGMMGAVSGMNEHGLTVTINADKSDFSLTGKTPVSIVARMVLQYAKNIKDAYNIINNAKMFVSESFLVGSASDRKAVIIEKTNEKTAVFEEASSKIICTNHFRSNELKNGKLNLEAIAEGTSIYRFRRTRELINSHDKHDARTAVAVLRNSYGIGNKNIGFGNEKAINQFIAHHGVIFKPEERLIWVSATPYQLGSFICYDLKKIFDKQFDLNPKFKADVRELMIGPDTLLLSSEYAKFLKFRKLKNKFDILIKDKQKISNPGLIDSLILFNPEYYLVYKTIGDYYSSINNYRVAQKYYKISLTKEISSKSDKDKIIKLISK